MALGQNRLEFLLTAKTEGIEKAFREADASARRTAKGITASFVDASGGVAKLEDALESADFSGIAEKAKASARDIKGAFDKTGDAVKAAFAKTGDSGLESIFREGADTASAFAATAKSTIQGIFDPAADSARDLKRQAELAFTAALAEAQKLRAELAGTFDGGKKSSKELRDALSALDKILGDVGKGGREDLEKVEKALRDIKSAASAARQEADALEEAFNQENLRDGAAALRGDVESLTSGFSDAGEEARRVDREIRKAFTSAAEAQKFSALVRELKGQFEGLEADEIVLAIKRMETFGVATEQNLRLVASAAQATGKSIDDLADPIGEFLASAKSGQDLGAFEELRAQIGVGAEALRPFGAQLDSNNKLLGETREQIRANNDALIAYLSSNERFAGVSERSQDAIGKAKASIDEFNTSVGEQVNILKGKGAEAIQGYLDGLNNLSDGQKAAVGVGAEFISSGVSVGAKALEIAAFAKIAGVSLGGPLTKGFALARTGALSLTGAITTLGAGSLALGGGILAAAGGLLYIAKTAVDAYEATQKLAEAQKNLAGTIDLAAEKTAEFAKFREASVSSILKEIDAIEDAGERRVAITAAILQKEAEAKEQSAKGNALAAGFIQKEIAALKGRRAAYDEDKAANAKAQEEAQKATEERFRASQEAFRKFKEDLSRGLFDSEKNALRSLESVMGGLSGEDLKAAQDQRRQLNQSILADEVDALKERVTENKVSAEESKQILADLERTYESHGDAKRDIDKDFTEFLKGEAEKRYQIQQQFLAKELDLKKSQLALDKEADTGKIDQSIAKLEQRIDKEENVFEELKRQNTERAKTLKTYADEEAALERVRIKREAANEIRANKNDATAIAKIKEQEALELQQLDQQTAQQKQQIDRDTAAQNQSLTKQQTEFKREQARKEIELEKSKSANKQALLEEEIASEEYAFRRRREMLEFQASMGRNVAAEQRKLEEDELRFQEAAVRKRLALRLEEIEQERKAADIGAKPAEKAVNAERAATEAAKARREAQVHTQEIIDRSNDALVAQTQEIQRQIDLIKQANAERKKGSTIVGEAQTVEEAFGSNASGWGVSRGQAEREQERNLRDLEAQRDRNLGMLANRAARRQKTGETFEPRSQAQAESATAQNFGDGFGQSRSQIAAEQAAATDDAGGRGSELLTAILAELKQLNQNTVKGQAQAKADADRRQTSIGLDFTSGPQRMWG